MPEGGADEVQSQRKDEDPHEIEEIKETAESPQEARQFQLPNFRSPISDRELALRNRTLRLIVLHSSRKLRFLQAYAFQKYRLEVQRAKFYGLVTMKDKLARQLLLSTHCV